MNLNADRTVFILILLEFSGCAPTDHQMDQTPADFEPYKVQAAAYVKRTSADVNVREKLDTVLRSLGCQSDGASYLADGTPAGVSYSDQPYLMLGVLLTGQEQLDVRMYYNRDRKSELEDWIRRFRVAVDEADGLSCEVYEEPSTGPF